MFRSKIVSMQIEIEKMELRSKSSNIEINGVREQPIENVIEIVNKIRNQLDVYNPEDILKLHRFRSANKNKPRPIIVKFRLCSAL